MDPVWHFAVLLATIGIGSGLLGVGAWWLERFERRVARERKVVRFPPKATRPASRPTTKGAA